MPTLNQLIYTQWRKKRKKVTRRRALQGCPQKKGTCLKTFLVSPRKPNSALRKVARVLLYAAVKPRNRKKFKFYKVNAYIPGEEHTLNRFSQVLVRGGPVKDLPGMQYTLIRRGYDFLPMETRRNARSKYGTKLTRWKLHHNYFKYKYW